MSELNNTTPYQQLTRISFDEESRYSWLSLLLDACHVIDKGIAEAINREQKQGRLYALAKVMKGCHWDTVAERMNEFDKKHG